MEPAWRICRAQRNSRKHSLAAVPCPRDEDWAVYVWLTGLVEGSGMQRWAFASLMEGGGVERPQVDGAGPMVSVNVAPSLICAWRNQELGRSTPLSMADWT